MASFGDTLRRERELRGVELREMAEATKISIRFLKALEQDRVDILPGGSFPRAFVRQYAKHLGLDPERLVAEFVYSHGAEPVQLKTRSLDTGSRGSYRGLIVAVLILAALVFLAWKTWWEKPNDASEGGSAASIPAGPAATVPTDRVFPPPTAPTAASPVPAGKIVVALVARNSSWAEAKVDGAIAFNRVLNSGETERLEANREVVLSVGNAGGIALTLNGRPGVSLGRSGEVRRNIVINAQSIPSMVQGATAGGIAAPLLGASPRPATPRPRPTSTPEPTPEEPTASPEPTPASPEPSPAGYR